MPSLYFFMPDANAVIWNTFFKPSILLQSRSARGWKGLENPASRYFFSISLSRIPLLFLWTKNKQTNKAQFTVWSKRRQHSKCARLIRSLPLKRLISRIHNIRAKTSRIPCLSKAWLHCMWGTETDINFCNTFFVSSFSWYMLLNGWNKSVTPSLIISAVASSKLSAGHKPNHHK